MGSIAAVNDHVASRAGLAGTVIARDLRKLGVTAGQTLLVHSSLSSIGWVDGGATTVVAALREVLGPAGTLVVPTTTAENSDTSREHLARIAGMTPRQVRSYRDAMPSFDRASTPARGAGRIAEEVRVTRGAIRSAHPQTSFAAIGPLALPLMKDHRLDCHLGERSPLGKLYAVGAWVLLLGVGYQACSAPHLAEYLYAPSPPRRTYRCVVRYRGRRMWRAYKDVVLDDSEFGAIGELLDKEKAVHRGYVGNAECRLMRMREVVDYATTWMRERR
jgi:aminoglycoside 3-N-acetyltransferase